MLEELKEQYRKSLPDKLNTIKGLIRELRGGNQEAETRLRHVAHTLHGSGSTFGFPEISAAARDVELAAPNAVALPAAALIRVLIGCAMADGSADRLPVLIVDDDADIANLLKVILTQKIPQQSVLLAATGAEALQLIQQRKVALILLDMQLPDTDGRLLLKQIRAQFHEGIPVYMLSADQRSTTEAECLQLGANGYFHKPFSPEAIADAVSKLLHDTQEPAPPQSTPAEPEAAPVPVAEPGARKVLLADDDELLAQVISHRLRREGLVVKHVNNGAAALTALQEDQFSLLILDVKMPVIDGFEVLANIRGKPEMAGIPIIMLTAMGSEKDVVRGYDLGVNDYMLKPFSPVELVAKVKRFLKIG